MNQLAKSPDLANSDDIAKASFRYLPVLDGFRAVSIILVVLSHADLGNNVPGGLGVTVFFVISGFLITRQLVAEIEATGDLKFGAFYLRRAFRLAPALLLYLLLFDSLLLALGATITWTHVASALFYFANYYQIFIGYPPHNPNPILWSLAIEEHFYLVAPFVIFLFRRNLRSLLPYLGAVLVLVLLWRTRLYLLCSDDPSAAICGIPKRRYLGTDMLFDCIAYGCATALILNYNGAKVRELARHSLVPLFAAAVLIGSLLVRNPMFRETARYSVQSAAVAVILVSMLYDRWPLLVRVLSSRPFLYVGRISYSLYLFHYGVLVVMMTLWPGQSFLTVKNMTLYLTSTFALASFSYFFLERPMVEVRRRLRGSSSRTVATLSKGSPEQASPASEENTATLLQR